MVIVPARVEVHFVSAHGTLAELVGVEAGPLLSIAHVFQHTLPLEFFAVLLPLGVVGVEFPFDFSVSFDGRTRK